MQGGQSCFLFSAYFAHWFWGALCFVAYVYHGWIALFLCSGSALTENEETLVRNTVINLSDAGMPEVNGDYYFVNLKCNGGYYARNGTYDRKPARFTLYKCNLNQGGYQWFISLTPAGAEPGTAKDIDFYYAPGKLIEKLPPVNWFRVGNNRDPPPMVLHTRVDDNGSGVDLNAYGRGADSSSESEPENGGGGAERMQIYPENNDDSHNSDLYN